MACCLPYSVGRGLDPAVAVCLMRTFLGNVAAPGPALQDLVSLLAIAPSFLTGQKGSEKAAANSEARGTAKGACGPLWKPRRSNGVARDGFRFSQGKGSLLQYRFFPAGTTHPGSRSETPPAFAGGRSAANACFTRLPAILGRFVGAACMRPVTVCLMVTFLVRVRGCLICRGGMYAARETVPLQPVYGL